MINCPQKKKKKKKKKQKEKEIKMRIRIIEDLKKASQLECTINKSLSV